MADGVVRLNLESGEQIMLVHESSRRYQDACNCELKDWSDDQWKIIASLSLRRIMQYNICQYAARVAVVGR